jgi:hypothetical protein
MSPLDFLSFQSPLPSNTEQVSKLWEALGTCLHLRSAAVLACPIRLDSLMTLLLCAIYVSVFLQTYIICPSWGWRKHLAEPWFRGTGMFLMDNRVQVEMFIYFLKCKVLEHIIRLFNSPLPLPAPSFYVAAQPGFPTINSDATSQLFVLGGIFFIELYWSFLRSRKTKKWLGIYDMDICLQVGVREWGWVSGVWMSSVWLCVNLKDEPFGWI